MFCFKKCNFEAYEYCYRHRYNEFCFKIWFDFPFITMNTNYNTSLLINNNIQIWCMAEYRVYDLLPNGGGRNLKKTKQNMIHCGCWGNALFDPLRGPAPRRVRPYSVVHRSRTSVIRHCDESVFRRRFRFPFGRARRDFACGRQVPPHKRHRPQHNSGNDNTEKQ